MSLDALNRANAKASAKERIRALKALAKELGCPVPKMGEYNHANYNRISKQLRRHICSQTIS